MPPERDIRTFLDYLQTRLPEVPGRQELIHYINTIYDEFQQKVVQAGPPRLVLSHECRSKACSNAGCELCKHTLVKPCERLVKKRYLNSEQVLTRCGSALTCSFTNAGPSHHVTGFLVYLVDSIEYSRLEEKLGRQPRFTEVMEAQKVIFLKSPPFQKLTTPYFRVSLELGAKSALVGDPDLSPLVVTKSTQTGLTQGKDGKGRFRLLMVAQGQLPDSLRRADEAAPGQTEIDDILPAVSEEFMVGTAGQRDEPITIDSDIDKLNGIGTELSRMMKDLIGWANKNDPGLADELLKAMPKGEDGPLKGVQKVGEFRDFIAHLEKNAHLKERFKRKSRFTQKIWESASEHAAQAVEKDYRARVYLRRSDQWCAVFEAKDGAVLLDRPLGYTKGLGAGTPVLSSSPGTQALAASSPEVMRDRVFFDNLRSEAIAAWGQPGHPGWQISEDLGVIFGYHSPSVAQRADSTPPNSPLLPPTPNTSSSSPPGPPTSPPPTSTSTSHSSEPTTMAPAPPLAPSAPVASTTKSKPRSLPTSAPPLPSQMPPSNYPHPSPNPHPMDSHHPRSPHPAAPQHPPYPSAHPHPHSYPHPHPYPPNHPAYTFSAQPHPSAPSPPPSSAPSPTPTSTAIGPRPARRTRKPSPPPPHAQLPGPHFPTPYPPPHQGSAPGFVGSAGMGLDGPAGGWMGQDAIQQHPAASHGFMQGAPAPPSRRRASPRSHPITESELQQQEMQQQQQQQMEWQHQQQQQQEMERRQQQQQQQEMEWQQQQPQPGGYAAQLLDSEPGQGPGQRDMLQPPSSANEEQIHSLLKAANSLLPGAPREGAAPGGAAGGGYGQQDEYRHLQQQQQEVRVQVQQLMAQQQSLEDIDAFLKSLGSNKHTQELLSQMLSFPLQQQQQQLKLQSSASNAGAQAANEGREKEGSTEASSHPNANPQLNLSSLLRNEQWAQGLDIDSLLPDQLSHEDILQELTRRAVQKEGGLEDAILKTLPTLLQQQQQQAQQDHQQRHYQLTPEQQQQRQQGAPPSSNPPSSAADAPITFTGSDPFPLGPLTSELGLQPSRSLISFLDNLTNSLSGSDRSSGSQSSGNLPASPLFSLSQLLSAPLGPSQTQSIKSQNHSKDPSNPNSNPNSNQPNTPRGGAAQVDPHLLGPPTLEPYRAANPTGRSGGVPGPFDHHPLVPSELLMSGNPLGSQEIRDIARAGSGRLYASQGSLESPFVSPFCSSGPLPRVSTAPPQTIDEVEGGNVDQLALAMLHSSISDPDSNGNGDDTAVKGGKQKRRQPDTGHVAEVGSLQLFKPATKVQHN